MRSDFSLNNSDNRTYTRNYLVCITVVMLEYDWWLCMVINIISVQYNGGLLPDIILSTQGTSGEPV